MHFNLSTNSGELNKTPQEKLLATSKTEARMVKWRNLDFIFCSRALSISRVSGNSSLPWSLRTRFRYPWYNTVVRLGGSGSGFGDGNALIVPEEVLGETDILGSDVISYVAALVIHFVVQSRRSGCLSRSSWNLARSYCIECSCKYGRMFLIV